MAEINERGNEVIRMFEPEADRYCFDFKHCTPSKGWLQFDTDQDAHYFGVWVNKSKRWIVTYAEGDVTIVKCPTVESFNMEIKGMCEFYGVEANIRTIDLDGTYTKYYQDRQEFFIEGMSE